MVSAAAAADFARFYVKMGMIDDLLEERMDGCTNVICSFQPASRISSIRLEAGRQTK